jgi:hypothetical protein
MTAHSLSNDATTLLASLAADLADAAYKVVLRHGVGGSWIDMQLDVWRALAATFSDSGWRAAELSSAIEVDEWRESFLSQATDAAYRTALRHGVQGSFLEVELELHGALRRIFERPATQSELGRISVPGVRIVADAVLSRFEKPGDRGTNAGRNCCHNRV